MKHIATTAILATTLALPAAPAAPPASADPVPGRAHKPAVTVTLPDSLVEGDRFTIEVKVARTTGAGRILLQRLTTDVLGHRSWETVRRSKVAGKKRHEFGAVAGEDDRERYRARVLYKNGGPAQSRPTTTTVWHWVSMMEFTAYSYTNGVSSSAYNQFGLNGIEYRGGWATYGDHETWETRFTPGRHCRAFRGVAGLTDDSSDGASGAVQLVADETTTVYSSPALTPGMAVPFLVDLATPYRLFIEAQRTSPAGQAAYPAIGDPQLLCTGLE